MLEPNRRLIEAQAGPLGILCQRCHAPPGSPCVNLITQTPLGTHERRTQDHQRLHPLKRCEDSECPQRNPPRECPETPDYLCGCCAEHLCDPGEPDEESECL